MNKTLGTGSIDRSARVRRIKRVIIALIVIAILFPSVLCIILFAKLNKLEKQITELSYAKERVNVITESTKLYEPKKSNPLPTGTDSETISIEKIEKENTESIEVVDETATEPEIDTLYSLDEASESPDEKTNAPTENEEIALKRVYLTFDDGPSSNTSKILDILKEKNVKATFFVVGRLSDTTTPMYKRIVDEGHSIGMHSYTHKYDEIYKDTDSFIYDVEKIQLLIYEQTGIMSKLYRFPGGSSNTVSRTDINVLAEELKNGILVAGRHCFENELAEDIIAESDGNIVASYSNISSDPDVTEVDACADVMRDHNVGFVIAVGGGSVIDLAKAAAGIVFSNDSITRYHGTGVPLPKKHLPIIALPTTSGTGSEVTCVSVLTNREQGIKAPVNSETFYPVAAIVDPELTYSMPEHGTASCGIDVLAHAIEGFWSKGHQPICDSLALHAAGLVFRYLRTACASL